MILYDFNNQANIKFAIACKNILPNRYKSQGKAGKFKDVTVEEDFKLRKAFIHDMISHLHDLHQRYSGSYGNLVVCVDSPNNWRRSFYPLYKQNRIESVKKDNPYEKWLKQMLYSLMEEVIEILQTYTSSVTVMHNLKISIKGKIYGFEADDIIGILALQCQEEKHLIISNDGDFKQLVSPNIRIYDTKENRIQPPINQKVKEKFILKSIIGGVSKDNIPNIKKDTLLNKEFVQWFNQNNPDMGLDIYDIDKIDLISEQVSQWIEMKNRKEEMLVKNGKKKRAKRWSVFEDMRFGEKAVEEFMIEWKEHLFGDDVYEPWLKNYRRNEFLFLLNKIPNPLVDFINTEFNKRKKTESKLTVMQQMKLKKQLVSSGWSDLAGFLSQL